MRNVFQITTSFFHLPVFPLAHDAADLSAQEIPVTHKPFRNGL